MLTLIYLEFWKWIISDVDVAWTARFYQIVSTTSRTFFSQQYYPEYFTFRLGASSVQSKSSVKEEDPFRRPYYVSPEAEGSYVRGMQPTFSPPESEHQRQEDSHQDWEQEDARAVQMKKGKPRRWEVTTKFTANIKYPQLVNRSVKYPYNITLKWLLNLYYCIKACPGGVRSSLGCYSGLLWSSLLCSLLFTE